PERRARLEERDRFARDTARLRVRHKLAEAAAAAEQWAAAERALTATPGEGLADALRQLRELHEARADFAAARQARAQLLARPQARCGNEAWQATDARLGLAFVDLLAKLDPAQRDRLAAARQLLRIAGGSHEDAGAALDKAREALAILRQVLGED